MKTFALPIWNSSCDIFTDFKMCSTPRLASPFQRGHVSWVSSAYLRSNKSQFRTCVQFGLQITLNWNIGIHFSPEEEFLENPPVREPRPANPNVLFQSQIVDLVFDPVVLPVLWPLRLARLNTADVVRGALHERAHERVCLAFVPMNQYHTFCIICMYIHLSVQTQPRQT